MTSSTSALPPGVQALFQNEGLAEPLLPAHLAQALHPQGRGIFATKPLIVSPYTLEVYLAEIEADPDLPDYAVIGFDGHGFNSWATHCYVVDKALAMFIQLPWGGAFIDADEARSEIADVFAWAAELQAKLKQAASQGRIPDGWRLEVAASRFGHAGWRWLATGRDNASVPWNPSAGMKAEILNGLDDVIAGRRALEQQTR